ncbi:AAA family ATPase [Pyrobaculum neutrophilum]|uniref:AAA family ATPase n=1 Tax=Pyrobaculum neutrophilum TaxID=70771 RepID=UPI00164FA759|nr:ATP-binding protein [Pyrobaculum neutrophilum]
MEPLLRGERTVLIFDEFPYLVDVDPSVLSRFQRLWDEVLSRTEVFLVLCGSSVSVMEGEVLGYRSPLYGRRTASWKLGELPLSAVKFFYPRPFEERLYGVAGGVPMYLRRFDASLPFWENVRREFFTKGGFLYEEAEFLLRQVLSRGTTPWS